MGENSEFEKFECLFSNEKVGLIGNYFTLQVINNYFEIIEVPYKDYSIVVETENLSKVIIDTNIYEEDHPWKDYNLFDIKQFLEAYNVEVFFIDFTDTNSGEVLDICIDYSIKSPIVENEILYLPFILDEKNFNPYYAKNEKDILLFSDNQNDLPSSLSPFLKNKKVTRAKPDVISRKVIKTLVHVLKRTSLLFIIHDNMNENLLKVIEIIATLQNTLVLIQSNNTQVFKYALLTDSMETTTNYIRFIFGNEDYSNKIKVKNSRDAFLKYTTLSQENAKPEIGVLVVSMREERLSALFKSIGDQKHVSLHIVLLTHGFKLSDEKIAELKQLGNYKLTVVNQNLSVSLGECLNKCLEFVQSDYVIKMDDDDYYFPNFIIDLYIAQKYSNAEVVGKYGFYFYLKHTDLVGKRRTEKQFVEVSEVKGNSIFCKTSVLKKYKFSDMKRHEDSDLFGRIRSDKGSIYCIHPFDMCVFRDSNKNNHSYQVEDVNFLRDAKTLYFGAPNETISSE